MEPDSRPVYGPRPLTASKLDPFKPYLEERMRAGVWNARVLLRELQQRSYAGSYTILADWLRPQRESARTVAVRRFETPAGKQGQVDWGHLGTLEVGGEERKLHLHAGLQPYDDGRSRARSETGHITADA
jgi:transposase